VRVLFTTQPGHGHLNPMLPYAAALRDADHEVRFATAPSFCAAVERMGFPVSPAGYDFTWERVVDTFPEMAGAMAQGPWHVGEFSQRIAWEHWTPRMADDLLGLVADWRPELIVREAAEYGGTLAGQVAGIPVACALWGAPFHDSAWGRHIPMDPVYDGYDAQCKRLGIASSGQTAVRGELMLTTLPPSWMAAGEEGLGRIEHFRSEPRDQTGGAELPERLAELAAGGFVYATLGTVFNTQHQLRKAMLTALADIPRNVLFTAGPGVDLDRVGVPAANITVESFVPQSLVVPRAELVVSHAGLGTIIGALYAGVPMVLISFAIDHPVNTERAVALGVARVLDATECQPERLRETILDTLADEELRRRAAGVREECLSLPEIARSATVLETYAYA
jgi:UDP:flavonoid glycosyltransferase YjiC (YdhE family)